MNQRSRGPLQEGEEVIKAKEIYKKADQKAIIKRRVGGDVEQFGGAEIGGAGRGEEPPTGCPTPVILDE